MTLSEVHMKNRLPAITVLFIILFIWSLSASGFSSEAPEAAGLKEVVLRVEGMT